MILIFLAMMVVGVVRVATEQISPDIFITDIWAPSFVELLTAAVYVLIPCGFILKIIAHT